MRILTSEKYSDEIILPGDNNSSRLLMGTSYVFYAYANAENNNNYTLLLYDFDGNIIKSYDTNYTNPNDIFISGDRYIISFYNNGIYTLMLVTPTNLEVVEKTEYSRLLNDYAWYND